MRRCAASWFHSKAQHFTFKSRGLNKMRTVFDHRQGKLSLRKEFKSRTWKPSENFIDYYHQTIDYMIDGVKLRDYSKPRRVITNRGTALTLNAFKDFLEIGKIEQVLIAVGTPCANGQKECRNRVITSMMAKSCEILNKWD
ncbi:hypothetical protein ANTQUA_LOCUS10402 [Anthophora quadrimaculata]